MYEQRGTSAYKGLAPYTEEDAAFFFGRDRDIRTIIANLFATRVTVLYGPSGVGKSSVLGAGVAQSLRQREGVILIVFRKWYDQNPVAELKEEINRCVREASNRSIVLDAEESLYAYLKKCTDELECRVMVILDQFEEYFLYVRPEQERAFVSQLAAAVNAADLPANFLVSLREDSLSKLDRFQGRIPNILDNNLRLEHLDRDRAREAITRPLETYSDIHGVQPPVYADPELVEAVIDQVTLGAVIPENEQRRGLFPTDAGRKEQVEAPMLQLVLSRLWDEEQAYGSNELRLETLQRLGGAELIGRNYFDQAIYKLDRKAQETAFRAFRFLVTPSGSKIALTGSDLAEFIDLPVASLDSVLQELTAARILRSVAPVGRGAGGPRYEIFHDVLAPAIMDWRARYAREVELEERERRARLELEERERRARLELEERERRARRESRRLKLIVAGLAVFLLMLVMLTTFAIRQRTLAVQQRDQAERLRRVSEQQRLEAERLRVEADNLRKRAEEIAQVERMLSQAQTERAIRAESRAKRK